MVPPSCPAKKISGGQQEEGLGGVSENIINLTCCIITKMPAFRVDKFSAGRTKCMSPMLKRTWWNSLELFQIVNL